MSAAEQTNVEYDTVGCTKVGRVYTRQNITSTTEA